MRFHPILLFEPGGHVLDIERIRFNHRVSGIDPGVVQATLGHLDAAAFVLHVRRNYGRLKNIGVGPAFDVRVIWESIEIVRADDLSDRSPRTLLDVQYPEAWNSLPVVPAIVEPGGHAELTRIPSFLYLDFEQSINEVSGDVRIVYRDITGRVLESRQRFIFWTRKAGDEQEVSYGVTFRGVKDLSNFDHR